MSGSTIDATRDAVIAEDIAREVADSLVRLREKAFSNGVLANDIGKIGDRESDLRIRSLLGEYFPDDCILSEEGVNDSCRFHGQRVWIVDPLDGTREFSSQGNNDWAIHIALWERNRSDIAEREGRVGALTIGVVALPATGGLYSSRTVGTESTISSNDSELVIAVSASRPPVWATDLAQAVGGELLPMGSAGAKAMEVVEGRADAYVHAGGQYEWDSAAPVAVAKAAGLFVSRVDGSDLSYNQIDPYLPDLIVCRPELGSTFVKLIRKVGGG